MLISFYLSITASRLLRQTFIKGLVEFLPRSIRPRFQLAQMNNSSRTVTNMRRGEVLQH